MTFKPQLAEDINKLKVPVTFDKLGSTKLDGIRLATWQNQPLTRSLKVIPNKHVAALVQSSLSAAYLDGELIIGEPNDPEVYRNTFSGVMTIEGKPDFTYYVFDDLSDLSLTFEQRLDKLYKRQATLPSWVKILDQALIKSQQELDARYEALLEEGYEGLMIRNPQSRYKFGRCTVTSQDSLKVKPFQDAEAEIISVYEAEENLNEAFTNELGYTDRSTHAENKIGKGMAGGFVARDLATGVIFRCSAGKLKHVEREYIWKDREKFKGMVVTYRSMVGGVKDLPRHPRFIKWFRSPVDM